MRALDISVSLAYMQSFEGKGENTEMVEIVLGFFVNHE